MNPSAPVDVSRRPLGSRAALLAAVAFLGGCTLSPTPPTIAAATPDWGYNGEPTEIEIEGAHFFPTVIVDGQGSRLQDGFQAWLVSDDEEAVPLGSVEQLSYERLSAKVPEGLATGVYDLRVEVPAGLVATAEDAFTVTDTRADHLKIYFDTIVYRVGEYAPVTIRLQDPEGYAVAQELDVAISASSESGAVGVGFWPEGLVGQQDAVEGVGVTGSLAADGTGSVLLTSSVADIVTIDVVPLDGASPVSGDSLVLSWEPGPVAEVELSLPRQKGFRTRAGDPFTLSIALKDTFGNVLTDQSAELALLSTCGPVQADMPVLIVGGRGELEVVLTDACDANTLYTFEYAKRWDSAPFEVLPAEQATYEVRALRDPVTAGDQMFVLVDALDAYGNLVPDHAENVTLYDDLGGLDPERERGEQSCPGFEGGSQFCSGSLWTSGPEVIIRAEDENGHSGKASPIEVLPADPAALLLIVDGDSSVEAGEVFDVSVRVIDAFGNSVGFDPGSTDPVLFLDDSGTVACTWRGASDGAQDFACTIEGAVTDANLEATVLGVTGTVADPLTVTNAALDLVELDPQGAAFVAGSAFTVELRGYDEYGNSYVTQTDAEVDLSDSGGAMTPASAVLGADGTVQVSAVIYGAGSSVRMYASQGGVRLGVSRPLLVAPDVQDGLSVVAPPWISVDAPATVQITAVDAYDNAITTYAGSVTVSAVGGSCETVVVDTFVEGAASIELTCGTAALAEVIAAGDTSGFTGESDVVDVVDLACAAGPTASLALDGDDATIRCLADGDTVEIDADASGSVAGAAGITVRHFSDAETLTERTLSSAATFTYDSTGTRYVELLVADAQACADLTGGYVYVGSDDGEPTGPVSVSTSTSTVTSTGTLTVTLSATDCTSDVAAGQTLLVRADLGTPGGTATGDGLAVTLDGSGTASLDWTFDTGFIGTATVYAGSEGGGGIGTASVSVTGDQVLPTVLEVTPSGVELGTIPSIEIVFSEPMSATFITSRYIALTGPLGTLSGTFTQSSDLTTVVFVPDAQLDGAAGSYTLSLSQNLRDTAGNQLDGAWAGIRGPATFSFGDVAEAVPEISSCTVADETFTPDGDPGSGAEAEEISVPPTATSAPSWWWLSVYDADGTRVRSLRDAGTETAVTWDGRGDDGIMRDAGRYRLSLAPIDTYGNVGGSCDVSVELEQHVDLP